MEREPHRPNYAELKKEQEEAQQREATRPDQIRSPGWTDRGDMASQQQSALEYNKRANEHLQNLQERKEEQRPDVVNAPEQTPENSPTIEEARKQEPQPEKKADEQEFDAKRFMTDPDYRQQMKEQRQAEQRERTESREQGTEQSIVSGHQR